MIEPVKHDEPGGQGEHSDWREREVRLLKLPFSHGSGAEAPRGQTDPGSHGSHDVALGEDWYVPPSHGEHSASPNAADTEPGGHGVGVTEPIELLLPGGERKHCEAVVS